MKDQVAKGAKFSTCRIKDTKKHYLISFVKMKSWSSRMIILLHIAFYFPIHYLSNGAEKCADGFTHCDGAFSISYGTVFEIFPYKSNNHIKPINHSHFVIPVNIDTY